MSKVVTVSEVLTKEICIKVGGVAVLYARNPEDGRAMLGDQLQMNQNPQMDQSKKVLTVDQCAEAKRLLNLLEEQRSEGPIALRPTNPKGNQNTSLRLVS